MKGVTVKLLDFLFRRPTKHAFRRSFLPCTINGFHISPFGVGESGVLLSCYIGPTGAKVCMCVGRVSRFLLPFEHRVNMAAAAAAPGSCKPRFFCRTPDLARVPCCRIRTSARSEHVQYVMTLARETYVVVAEKTRFTSKVPPQQQEGCWPPPPTTTTVATCQPHSAKDLANLREISRQS